MWLKGMLMVKLSKRYSCSQNSRESMLCFVAKKYRDEQGYDSWRSHQHFLLSYLMYSVFSLFSVKKKKTYIYILSVHREHESFSCSWASMCHHPSLINSKESMKWGYLLPTHKSICIYNLDIEKDPAVSGKNILWRRHRSWW